jgi:hypothetical protein
MPVGLALSRAPVSRRVGRGLHVRRKGVLQQLPGGRLHLALSKRPARPPRADVVRKVCAPPRGGEGAEIHVWRTDRNEAAILELRQGAAGRPHPVIVFHDIAGNAQLSLPAALPAPESALGRSLTEQRAALLAGLRAAETIRCVP